MRGGSLDAAPIWTDLATFDGRAWRGKVDCISAGFPCQPFSVAGKREGTDDDRWLWPDIAWIIGEVEPEWVFLENVPGLVSGGGLEPVLWSLAQMRFDAEWDHFSAAEVGASHKRERVFVVAHRKGVNGGVQLFGGRLEQAGVEPGRQGGTVAYPCGSGLGRRQGVGCHDGEKRPALERDGRLVAHTSRERMEGNRPCGEQESYAQGETVLPRCDSLPLFPPGPDDHDAWAGVLAERPDLAPAVEPPLRGMADGSPGKLAGRADQLRAGGNGVVVLQAAYAFAVLAERLREETG